LRQWLHSPFLPLISPPTPHHLSFHFFIHHSRPNTVVSSESVYSKAPISNHIFNHLVNGSDPPCSSRTYPAQTSATAQRATRVRPHSYRRAYLIFYRIASHRSHSYNTAQDASTISASLRHAPRIALHSLAPLLHASSFGRGQQSQTPRQRPARNLSRITITPQLTRTIIAPHETSSSTKPAHVPPNAAIASFIAKEQEALAFSYLQSQTPITATIERAY
jgi:hypothetical protein